MSYTQVVQLQNAALIDRLGLILQSREKNYSTCGSLEDQQRFSNWNKFLLNSTKLEAKLIAEQKKIINSLINEVRYSQKISFNCLPESIKIESIRTNFYFLKNSEKNTNLDLFWGKELEPACYKVRIKGKLNQIDGNACFAGDRVIYSNLKKNHINIYKDALDFSYSLLGLLAGSTDRAVINIEDAFFNEFQSESREMFFTLLASISTSGPSGLTGWLQGLEDRLLIQDLNSNASSEEIYENFKALQLAKFNYIKFRDLSDQHKIELKLYGTNINSWNRHNLMALFLGCAENKKFEEMTPALIKWSGIFYELKDFISHLKEGDSLKSAKQNFSEDTNRYLVSGQIGYNLCKIKK